MLALGGAKSTTSESIGSPLMRYKRTFFAIAALLLFGIIWASLSTVDVPHTHRNVPGATTGPGRASLME
jgi:hypothetical protein